MKCPNCGKDSPDTNKFCQYCGSALQKPETTAISTKPEKSSSKMPIVVAIILTITTLACGAFAIVNYNRVTALTQELTTKENENAELSAAVADLNATTEKQEKEIQSLSQQADSYKEKAGSYDSIISALKRGKMGYGSSSFKVSDGVVYLSKNGGNKEITLSAGGGCTVSSSKVSGTSATLSFTESTWYSGTTKLRITPHSNGVTLYKITNDLGSSTIYVLIIVG